MTARLEPVFEGRLRYAQCWEDPEVLVAALRPRPGEAALAIGSGGDSALALAVAGADRVEARDLSGPQVAVARIKLAACRALEPAEAQVLLGFAGGPADRAALWARIRGALDPPARAWGDAHAADIARGLADAGRFERYLRLFRTRVLPLVQRRSTVDAVLAAGSLDEQRRIYEERWNTRRWRAVFRVFFSRRVMAALGRSPEQFAQVRGPVADAFLARAERVLTEIPTADNPFLWWVLRGRVPDPAAARPHLSAEGAARLRAAEVRVQRGDILREMEEGPPARFDLFALSDLPEYLTLEEHERLLRAVLRAARPGARVAWWTLLTERPVPASLAGRLEEDRALGAALLARDRAFVYGGFHVATVRGPAGGGDAAVPGPARGRGR